VYARDLFKYFLYVAHVVTRAIACWIARRSRAVAHIILRASPHVVFACRACGSCTLPYVVRVLSRVCPRVVALFARCRTSGSRVARILRVDHACRAASAHDNKLFSLINSHVNNVNSSGHIF
jgi:hypothetical protein